MLFLFVMDSKYAMFNKNFYLNKKEKISFDVIMVCFNFYICKNNKILKSSCESSVFSNVLTTIY